MKMPRLTKKHIEVLEQLRGGVDVYDVGWAKVLQDMRACGFPVSVSIGMDERKWVKLPPGVALFELTEAMTAFDPAGQAPYFGAVLLRGGEEAIKEYQRKHGKAGKKGGNKSRIAIGKYKIYAYPDSRGWLENADGEGMELLEKHLQRLWNEEF